MRMPSDAQPETELAGEGVFTLWGGERERGQVEVGQGAPPVGLGDVQVEERGPPPGVRRRLLRGDAVARLPRGRLSRLHDLSFLWPDNGN